MRRLFAARGTSAAAVGVLVVLVAGGGYAFASGNKTITACVHHAGGDIYIAKKCAKHDKKLSWGAAGAAGSKGATGGTGAPGATGGPGGTGAPGAAGPQGPGATNVTYDTTGTASPTPTTLGAMGPWTLSATCGVGGGITTGTVYYAGPGGRTDGIFGFGQNDAIGDTELSTDVFGPTNGTSFTGIGATDTTLKLASANFVFVPTSGTSVELALYIAVAGGTTNTCHFSAVITPSSSSTVVSDAGAAARPNSTATTSRSPGRSPLIKLFGRAVR